MFHTDTENSIVSCLTERKDLTIQELYTCITSKNVKVSLPNFYKIVGRMVDDQILVKTKGKLQIHAMYLHFIVGLADNIQKTYFAEGTHNIEKLQVGEQKVYTGASLYDLDIIRIDLLTQMMKKYPDEEGFHYNSHPYHILSMTEKEKVNMEETAGGLQKSYFLFGNTSFLDQYGSELYSMNLYTIACVDDAPFPNQGYCVNVVGDYIIECMLPENITHHYKIFFDTVKSLEGFNVHMFGQIIKMKEQCSLKLIHSPEHAKKMKQKIKKYFK